VVKDGALATPDRGIFEGITRRTVTEIAADLQMKCEVRPVRVEELDEADELFSSTTAGGITPITSYNGKPLGDGKPGPVTKRILELYWKRHEDAAYTTPVAYDE
jgi:branched-chain amino acid aminotransferase